MPVLARTELPGLRLLQRGKVRDNYDLGDALLIVSTDRISAFDHILPDPIPDKGTVLNQISIFWFKMIENIVPNHLREHRVERFPEILRPHVEVLRGRSVVVDRLQMLPVECVVRGYLSGSGFREYRKTGAICGIRLPPGLEESARLPEPLFTPATKATSGHDENIPFAKMVDIVGRELAVAARELSFKIFARAGRHAEERAIIIADTKFEFGTNDRGLVLGDEVLTPDSSRFWPSDTYRPGGPQPSFDKQFVRDYLETTGWDKASSAPGLPPRIIQGTSERYLDIFNRLTGLDLD